MAGAGTLAMGDWGLRLRRDVLCMGLPVSSGHEHLTPRPRFDSHGGRDDVGCALGLGKKGIVMK